MVGPPPHIEVIFRHISYMVPRSFRADQNHTHFVRIKFSIGEARCGVPLNSDRLSPKCGTPLWGPRDNIQTVIMWSSGVARFGDRGSRLEFHLFNSGVTQGIQILAHLVKRHQKSSQEAGYQVGANCQGWNRILVPQSRLRREH